MRRRVYDRLRQARAFADARDPQQISVRDLLSLWGAADRGDQVSRIEADLANHGLVTSPSFRAVTLDTVVYLATPPSEAEAAPQESVLHDDGTGAEDDEGDRDLEVGLTVGNLSPLNGVGAVGPNSSLDEAITTMLLNDYSQLAVLSGTRNLRGAVTWASIALAMHQSPSATLADAIDPHVEVVDYERDLFAVLPTLQHSGFVFIRDQSKAIAGIVTTADVAQRFGQMATPFFLLGELDQTLRWILSRAMSIEELRGFCGRKVGSVDQLTVGDYRRVLEQPQAWVKLGWPSDRAVFIARLEEIRLIRNKVMHFHPDPIPTDAVDKLRNFNGFLHRYRDPE
ncbi:hypothetical protein [Nocardia sp. NPDC058666]|uniref:hypothetical protein n=1 Tax=Nocardia sp. NPDC058666 TaxID=3346587 RepID=UPI003655B5A5